jgi:hypothetical protein
VEGVMIWRMARVLVQWLSERRRGVSSQRRGGGWGGGVVATDDAGPDCVAWQVDDRRSIDWSESEGRLVIGSLTAFKGRDWRVVFLLGVRRAVGRGGAHVFCTQLTGKPVGRNLLDQA